MSFTIRSVTHADRRANKTLDRMTRTRSAACPKAIVLGALLVIGQLFVEFIKYITFMIHIIWTGKGYLVFVVVFGCSLIANLIFNAGVGPGYYDNHKWPVAVSFLISAAICWGLGDYLRRGSDRVVIDKQTGKEFVINQSHHTLFFIPMRWWGPILLVGALILFAIELKR